jgi:hypothetical protein
MTICQIFATYQPIRHSINRFYNLTIQNSNSFVEYDGLKMRVQNQVIMKQRKNLLDLDFA